MSLLERAFIAAIMRLPPRLVARLTGRRPNKADGQTLDPRLQTLLNLGDILGRPLDEHTPEEARREARRYSVVAGGPAPRMRETRDLDAGGVRARLYVPERASPGGSEPLTAAAAAAAGPLLVYYHGGGDVIGDLDSHDQACRVMARAGAFSVLAIDYRLAPEHRFPACLDDAIAAYRWAVEHAASLHAAPERIAVGGDSVGGKLAAAVSIAARDDPTLRAPAAQLLFYPEVDVCCRRPSQETFATGFGLTMKMLEWFRGHYLGGDVPRSDPRVSPLHAKSHAGLPPAVVVTAGFDPLRDEGRAYADLLERAGCRVRYRCERALFHGFVTLGVAPEARRAVAEAAAALGEELGRSATERPVAVPNILRPRRDLPRTAIIGAGSSGITVARTFWERGLPFDCFDKSDRVGGMWVFKNSNGLSSAYRSLHINTSRARMEYDDLPMPADYPHFPGHELIARYFEGYVEHFELADKLRLRTGVEKAAPQPDGTFELTLDDGSVERYDALVVASGHHWDARWPEPRFPGSFDGHEMHSHYYVDPTDPFDFRGKRVVVVGMGNSAMDISCELGHEGVAERVFLSVRRGAYVFPHYLFGRVFDQALTLPAWMPFAWKRSIAALVHRIAVGRMESFGLPKPDHPIGHAHPTISSEILTKLGTGAVKVKPNITELMGDRVRFADGSVEQVDAIVYCTGYNVTFPFFDEKFIAAPDNDLPLFRRVYHPGVPNVFFVGLLQPLGAIMPIAEQQGRWIADHLLGDYALPAPEALAHDIRSRREVMFRRYVKSPRHTMQEDFDDYLWELARERAAGRRRAVEQGCPLPIPARAARVERTAPPTPAPKSPEPAAVTREA